MNNITITLIVLFCTTLSLAQESKLLIENVTVIPLHINAIWKNNDVIIEDGKVTDIRKHLESDTTKLEYVRINGEGKYLIPAYADAHAHLPSQENLSNYFLMNLANGVTTLRSMRGESWHVDIEDSEFVPRLLLSAPPVTRRDTLSHDDFSKLLKKYKIQGFDFLKILSVQNAETFNGLVIESKRNHLPLAGHCPRNVGIFNVCEAGVFQSIEHLGGFFSLSSGAEFDRAIELSIVNDVYHCPTLDWYYTGQLSADSLRLRPGVDLLLPEVVSRWEDRIAAYASETSSETIAANRTKSKKKFEERLHYLGYIYRQGGKLLLSPDASGIYGIPGFGIHTEMQHFAKAGISNYDILKAVCYNLSEMVDMPQEWGTIKVGVNSDMILLNENPLRDIKNANAIHGIIFKGKFYTKEDLLSKLNSEQ